MHPNEELIARFYAAFNERDPETMAACYHQDARFSDPVFSELHGTEITAMWTMLCLQAKTLKVDVSNIRADNDQGHSNWTACYEYGKPPRQVHNKVQAQFTFQEGKIIRHDDSFDLWKWSRMALGPLGFLMGWNAKVQEKIRSQAMRNLTKFTSITKKA